MSTTPTAAEAPAGALDPLWPRPFRVIARRRETADVVTLALRSERDGCGLAFEPGQFTMLYLPALGEVPISVSGDPAQPERLVHTVRAVGAVSRALARLPRGALVGVRGPYGRGWPLLAARGSDVVMLAGGLGLAPVRPILYRVLQERAAYGHVALLYGARSPAEVLFRRELERWRGRLDLDVRVTVDAAEPAWRGRVGVVTRLLRQVSFDPLHTVAFVCGPEVMMRFAARELGELGVATESVFVSLERNMKCAVGFCGHCQLGPAFVCRDGPVLSLAELGPWLERREV